MKMINEANGRWRKWIWFGAALLCVVMATARAEHARSAPLDEAAERYRSHLIASIDRASAGAQKLRSDLAAGDIESAKKAWIDARVGWERSEVFTSGFVPDLDRNIDAWPDAVTGFHAIEAKLFGAKRTDIETEVTALIRDLDDLRATVRRIDLPPQRLLNGVARLAYEVGESKVDGGESRVSGTSLDDMRNNVEGIDLAYRVVFASALEASEPGLAAIARGEIDTLLALVGAADLKKVDSDKLRAVSEELVVTLQKAAAKIGLRAPNLEDTGQ